MEVLVDAFTFLALEVGQSIDSKHMGVAQEVMGLQVEEGSASLGQSSLQTNESRNVFVVFSQMIQERDHLLAEDCCLNGLVSCVQRVLSEAT